VVRERAGTKVSYDVTARVVTGLKHYGDLGRVAHIDPPQKQEHLIFSVVDIDLGRGGNRFGPTPAPEPPRR
jgi:hypothetical protein